MARPRKPTSILKLENGKLYESRHGRRDGEPKPSGVPEMPEGMPEAAQAHWREVVPTLVDTGVAKAIDEPAIEQMCLWHAELRRLWAIPPDARDKPWGTAIARAREGWNFFAVRFGLTPSDRARLGVSEPREPSELSQMLN